MRVIVKSWDNRRMRRGSQGRPGQYNGWTYRISWYVGDTIRLRVEFPEGSRNVYFRHESAAQLFWDAFKQRVEAGLSLVPIWTISDESTGERPEDRPAEVRGSDDRGQSQVSSGHG